MIATEVSNFFFAYRGADECSHLLVTEISDLVLMCGLYQVNLTERCLIDNHSA